MKWLLLDPKIDVVIVERNTRGKFPGPKAKKATVGLVWSTWTSNSQWGTLKLSLLTPQGEVVFTTRSCVSKIGVFEDFKDLVSAYEKHVEEDYIPIFVTKPTFRSEKFIKMRVLGTEHVIDLRKNNIAKSDLTYMLQNPDENAYSVRIEPWVLKRFRII